MPRLIRPRAVAPGATIGLAAPGGAIDPGVFETGCRAWRDAGFRIKHRDDVTARAAYLAGDDARRSRELAELVADPEVGAIVCARGGYGCGRILNDLDASAFRNARKPLVGYSDITALLLWQRRHAGLVGFHGPMLDRGDDLDPASLDSLVRQITGTGPEEEVLAGRGRAGGRGAGRLVGGNLVMVLASLGTPWEIDTRGAILMLEEVHERPYRIDRMIGQLAAAGKLAPLAGVGLGAFTDCDDPRHPEPDAIEVILEALRPFGIPVVDELSFGHTARNLAWPVGARATIDAERGEVRVVERGVVSVQ